MNYIGEMIGLIALFIALTALYLQKHAIIKNGKINSLVHLSSILQSRIDYYYSIIAERKKDKKAWQGHADRINKELRPIKDKIDDELINLMSKHNEIPSVLEIRNAISNKITKGEKNMCTEEKKLKNFIIEKIRRASKYFLIMTSCFFILSITIIFVFNDRINGNFFNMSIGYILIVLSASALLFSIVQQINIINMFSKSIIDIYDIEQNLYSTIANEMGLIKKIPELEKEINLLKKRSFFKSIFKGNK